MRIIDKIICIAALSSLNMSYGDLVIPTEPGTPPTPVFSGMFQFGYATNYEFRGLIPTGENPVVPVYLDMRYDISDTDAITIGLKETVFIGDNNMRLDDELVFDFSYQKTVYTETYLSLSGRIQDGGFAERVASEFYNDSNNAYEVALALRHDIDFMPGFYVQGSVAYSFTGLQGWWSDLCIGSRARVSQDVHLGFQFGAAVTSSYWPAQNNGWQSMYLRIIGEYALTKQVGIKAFTGVYWLGHGAHNVNKRYGSQVVQGNRWVAGIGVCYSF